VRINLVTNSSINKAVAELDDIERLRRMFAAVHEKSKKPSLWRKIMARLRNRKIRKTARREKKTDAA